MNSKALVVGALGIGVLGLGAILVFDTGSSDETDLLGVNSTGRTLDIDPGQSAYALDTSKADQPAPAASESGSAEQGPRELQGARRGGPEGRDRGRDRFEEMEARILEYDKDGDGMLNDEEREAMMQAWRDRWIESQDLNGDGFVSAEEMVAAGRERMLNSPRVDRMKSRFDMDEDGQLNPEEEHAFNQWLDERDQSRMDRMVKQHDTDGDGIMSDEETLAMQQQWSDRSRSWIDSMIQQYDSDGDGMLNADERLTANNTMTQQREIDRFMNRYDYNEDGELTTSDYDRFVAFYGEKQGGADVNRDGVVNVDDLTAYRDMTEIIKAQDN